MHSKRASVKFIEGCYRLYEQKLFQIAYSILRDVQLAEDAVQEAFLKLMKHNIYFEDIQSDDCKRYMITVIKHASIDIYNKKRREQEMIYLSDKATDIKDVSGEEMKEEPLDMEELISDLPSKYYAVVSCLIIKNLSVRETARELGITEANVRKRFERAKRMLKMIVKGSDEYETGNELYKLENL